MVRKQDFEALIVRYLEGNANPEEAMLLEDWKKESTENQRQYDAYEKLFRGKLYHQTDVNAAWKKTKGELVTRTQTKQIPWRKTSYWLAVAAAIAVLVIMVPTFFDTATKPVHENDGGLAQNNENANVLFAKNGIQSYTLVDNSIVILENGSSLELSKAFEKGERRATLKGSGRFTVVHDEMHPFIIDVEGLEVYDIGTVFDISTHKDTVKVVVLEGAVELRKNGQRLAMEEGDSAFYLISERLIKEYPTKEAQEGVTVSFDDEKLEDVLKFLQEFFKKEMVIVDKELREVKVKISFSGSSLPEVISLLEVTLDIRAKRAANKIEFYAEN